MDPSLRVCPLCRYLARNRYVQYGDRATELAFEHVKEMEPDFEGINERLTSLYMLLKDKENFMKYNQLCEHPFKLEELNRLQQILQEDNQEELALVMKNIFNALQ